MRRDPMTRFMEKVDQAGPIVRPELGPCWIWTGARQGSGYGRFWTGVRIDGAHRFSWESVHGPVPSGFEVDHKCDNPPCVNPTHLQLLTHRANLLRSESNFAATKSRKTHCLRGHEFTEVNTYVTSAGRHCKTCRRLAKRKAAA